MSETAQCFQHQEAEPKQEDHKLKACGDNTASEPCLCKRKKIYSKGQLLRTRRVGAGQF